MTFRGSIRRGAGRVKRGSRRTGYCTCRSLGIIRKKQEASEAETYAHTIVAEEIGGIHMKRLCLLALATVFCSACASPQFTPQTLEGARCKLDCIDRASVMLLGSSYGQCIEACMDIDRLYKARETTPQ